MKRMTITMLCALLALGGCIEDETLGDEEQAATAFGGPSLPPDFTVSATLDSPYVIAGLESTLEVYVSSKDTRSFPVTLAVSAPPGSEIDYSANPVTATPTGTWVTVTISTPSNTTPGPYTITVCGSTLVYKHSVTASLFIAAPTLAVRSWPPAVNLQPGGSATVDVALSWDSSLTGPIGGAVYTWWAVGLPPGVSATFSPATGDAENRSVVTLSAATGVSVTPAAVTFVATGGGQVRATIVDVGPACQRIENGGFEDSTGWKLLGDARYDNALVSSYYVIDEAHAGLREVLLGGTNSSHGAIVQTITIPATSTTATLDYWISGAPGTVPADGDGDVLSVELSDASGVTTVDTIPASELPLPSGVLGEAPVYTRHSFDLHAFIGKQVTVQFVSTTDAANPSVFAVDDVSVATN